MRKKEVDKILEKLVKISDQTVSCETLTQLETVKEDVNVIAENIYGTRNASLIYNIGYVEGIIKHKEHTLTI